MLNLKNYENGAVFENIRKKWQDSKKIEKMKGTCLDNIPWWKSHHPPLLDR